MQLEQSHLALVRSPQINTNLILYFDDLIRGDLGERRLTRKK